MNNQKKIEAGIKDLKLSQTTHEEVTTVIEDALNQKDEFGFVVMVAGYWGAGRTLKAAALKCKEQGAGLNERAIARIVIGDNAPEVNSHGSLLHDAGSIIYPLGDGFKLGQLCKLEGA